MLQTKIVIVLIVLVCLLTTAGAAFPQTLSDAYALAETRADLPANWEAWPQTNDNQRGERLNLSDHRWMGRREKETEPVSPQNHILVSARIVVSLCKTPLDARVLVEEWLRPGRVAVPPVRGSYTGAPLGDECLRSEVDPNDAYLRFSCANVFFLVQVGGPTGDLDYAAVTEKIARAMLARADAALALAAGSTAQGLLSTHNVGVRHPRGVSVILVDEWTAGAAATWQADWKAGTATIKLGTHTLRLLVGRRDAHLDGKPITLPFPALRQGKDRLWCPLVVLTKLTG